VLNSTLWTSYSGCIGQRAAIRVINMETNLLDNEDFKTIIYSLLFRNGRVYRTDELGAGSLFTLFYFILPERLETAFIYCYARNQWSYIVRYWI
jgi:hypothetical protein